MSDVEIKFDNAAIKEFFKSQEIQALVKERADTIAANANAMSKAVMHTPNVDIYESGVRVGKSTAMGVVYAKGQKGKPGTLGQAIEAKYHILQNCTPNEM